MRYQPKITSPTFSLIACFTLVAFNGKSTDLVWTNTVGGNWATASNWSPNGVPGAADKAYITNNGSFTVSISSSAGLSKLILGGPGGAKTLQVGSTFSPGELTVSDSAIVLLQGGTLKDGTVNLSGGAVLNVAANNNNRFSSVTINGDVNLPNDDSLLRLNGVVTLNGVLTLSASRSRLCPEGDVSLLTSGGGQVKFTGTGWDLRRINNIGNTTLTLGPGLLVHGGFAEIGPAVIAAGSFGLTNYGTILGDFSGQAITLRPEVGWFVNQGTAGAQTGTLNIQSANFANQGVLYVGINSRTDNGRIAFNKAVTLEGTLRVVAGASYAPAAGDSFTLLTYPSRSGSFAAIELPGAAQWTTDSGATAFKITVSSTITGPRLSLARSGSDVVLSGTGGTPLATFYLLSSTNVALPMNQWRRASTNAYDAAGGFQINLAINYTLPQEFFRLADTP